MRASRLLEPGPPLRGAIDIIDRNLYERSCDVRWWATETALFEALSDIQNYEKKDHAAKRLKTILDSYTVYTDIIICTMDGEVLTNGKTEKYQSLKKTVRGEKWFEEAIHSANGNHFGYGPVHKSHLVNEEVISIYSCRINAGGDPNGRLLGVIGVLFNWPSLSNTVISHQKSVLEKETEIPTEIYIVDKEGKVLATTIPKMFGENLCATLDCELFQKELGYFKSEKSGDQSQMVAYSKSVGFETYRSDFICVITQKAAGK